MTGSTGNGKTVVALFLAALVGTDTNLGTHETKGGRVVYFAGENPDDVRQRVIGLKEIIPAANLITIVHPNPCRDTAEEIIGRLIAKGEEIALVVIDTSTIYFAGDPKHGRNENDNAQILEHAKWMRSICKRVPGNPTVLVCCHPIKNAGDDALIPRGGGAFLNEMDGNLACILEIEDHTLLKQHGKYRDVKMMPLLFRHEVVKPKVLKTASGKQMHTVIAHYVGETDMPLKEDKDGAFRTECMEVLEQWDTDPRPSLADIADNLGWMMPDGSGRAYRSKVQTRVNWLRTNRLIGLEDEITKKGRENLTDYQESKQNIFKKPGNGAGRGAFGV
jgi:hypothetical protein